MRGYVENDSHLQLKKTHTNKEIQKQMKHLSMDTDRIMHKTLVNHVQTVEVDTNGEKQQWNKEPG